MPGAQTGGTLEIMAVSCLIVDDNRVFLQAARELLERDGISVVGVASTGAEASHQCQDLQPDVALVDIDLGGENGFDVARQLTSGREGQSPRVILVSAYAREDFADLIADSPALSFLPKPDLSGAAIRGILTAAAGSNEG